MRHSEEKQTKQTRGKKEGIDGNPAIAVAEQPAYSPPPIDGDFYRIANVLNGGNAR